MERHWISWNCVQFWLFVTCTFLLHISVLIRGAIRFLTQPYLLLIHIPAARGADVKFRNRRAPTKKTGDCRVKEHLLYSWRLASLSAVEVIPVPNAGVYCQRSERWNWRCADDLGWLNALHDVHTLSTSANVRRVGVKTKKKGEAIALV